MAPEKSSGKPAATTDRVATRSDEVTPAAATSGGGVTFSFVYGTTTYDVQVNAPDPNGQYGFKVTQGTTVIAALTYKDDQNWQIAVGLPGPFKVDQNLTINTLNVNIENGTVVALD